MTTDVTTDIKTRYSIYVPKPLARINLGGWQRREGSSQSPRFGYDGVSIQTDKSLFIDVTKATYLQARGGVVAHAADWLLCSLKAMTFATTDAALVGADGTVTVAAGAGQGPTWTMDHGDSLETVPYLGLSLHYRVEEVQNSLFEFFRGRRKKKDPAMGRDLTTSGFARNWEMFLKDEVAFDSSDDALGKTEGLVGAPAIPNVFSYSDTPTQVLGGFELLAEKSWQKLWGKADWKYADKAAGKVAPHDLFAPIKDVRRDPELDAGLDADATANTGATATKALKWGFSGYFSRFDPYLLIDPDQFATDTKLSALEKMVCWALAKLNNLGVELKRRTDVLYKLSSVVKQLLMGNVLQNAVAAVDSFNGAVKSIRGNAEMLAAMGRGDRGWWGEQFGDEGISGLGTRGLNIKKINDNPRAVTTAQAVVRSGAPYKDPTDPNPLTASKGFYGAAGRIGGTMIANGTQVADGDQLHIKCKDKAGVVHEFDTPPLKLGATAAADATSAVITGTAVTTSALELGAGAWIKAQIDGGAWTTLDLTTVAPKPRVTGGSMTSGLYGAGGALVGTTLLVAVDGADVSVAFTAVNAADEATLTATLTQAFPGLDVTIANNGVVLAHKKYGPGASIEVKSSSTATAAALLGLTGTSVATGATVAALQAALAAAIGAPASLAAGALTLRSPLTGTLSSIRLAESPTGALAALGIASASADGAAAKAAGAAKDPATITADDLVALFATSEGATKGWVTFTAEDGQVVITDAYKGDGSVVEVSNKSGHMKEALTFLGDFRGENDRDEIRELPEIARGLDDFDKIDTELMKMPDDVGNLIRPLIVIGKNAMGMVSKSLGVAKSLAKVVGIKLPSPKGSIGLIANKGISLGTPDRIVGVGGQGVVFVADGGSGNPDHAKYVTFEDTFNRIIGADFFAKTEPYKAKDSLGFRVYSDTTADLVARNTAHVLALGRVVKGPDLVGSGVARVAGSYAVEIAAQDKVVIGARQDGTGRVEVLGDTLALGYTQPDADAHTFGLEDRGKAKGWPAALGAAHPKTSAVLVHAAEQASIVVGPYMVQVRSSKQQDRTLASAQLKAQQDQDQVTAATKALDDHQKLLRGYAITYRADPTNQVFVDGQLEMVRLTGLLADANKTLITSNKAVTAAQATNDEGIIISMRDPADPLNTAASSSAHKGKPSILVNRLGVTITTTAGDDDDTTARITLDDKGCTVKVGKKAGLLIAKDKVEITDGIKKATLGSDKFVVGSGTIDFSAGQKITLG